MERAKTPKRRCFIAKMQANFPSAHAISLGIFLCLLQAADGILTLVGVEQFGVRIEGNVMLRYLMEQFGHVEVLAVTKVFAIIVVVALTIGAKRVSWVENAIGALSCVYLFAAIFPWTYFLSKHLLVL